MESQKVNKIVRDYLDTIDKRYEQLAQEQSLDGSGECGKFIWAGFDGFVTKQREEAIKALGRLGIEKGEANAILDEAEFSPIEGIAEDKNMSY